MSYSQPGQTLKNGKYQIQKTLGGGGFGVTYLASETSSQQKVAIKTLNLLQQNKPDFAEIQEKFVNEAMCLAKCSHPHIVKVDSVFQHQGLWYMVMEYIEGEDLNEHLKEKGKLTEAEALPIIQQVGEALIYIHQQGFLHRDVKPANIIRRRSNLDAVLIDFGLAREFDPSNSQSMTNARTEGFAPLEQYDRKGKFGPYTDVYALAATLYNLLTDDMPFPAHIRDKANLPLTPPQQYNSAISDRVNNAILSGMALAPSQRPQSVAAWLKLLHLPVTASRIREDSKTIEVSPPQNKTPWYLKLFTPPDSPLPLTPFQFDVVTVDKYGKINNRRRGEAQYFLEKLNNQVGIEMVSIPGGTFMMGSPESEEGHHSSQSPQHKVTVPPFFMGKYPVTQAQWRVVAGFPQVNRSLEPNPSYFKGDNLPVVMVSWYDCVEFCDRLSKQTGRKYRLPSEAEWEYACRAGTTTPFHFGKTITTDLANYNGIGEYREKTTPVGSFQVANNFGLYDMHGNVWEWCVDIWQDSYKNTPINGDPVTKVNSDNKYRLLRGGSWGSNGRYCRSANRSRYEPDFRHYDRFGFRLVVS